MMAPHRSRGSNGERYPSRETLEILRRALAQYLDGGFDDDQVCGALVVLAEEAKDKRLHAEDVLIAFKEVWSELPEVLAIKDPVERKALLDHLVKLCIDAVYKR